MFESTIPKWSCFIKVLMKQQKRKTLESDAKSTSDSSNQSNDQETSWLVTTQNIDELNTQRYYAYQIVYAYINKSIITPQQRLEANKL